MDINSKVIIKEGLNVKELNFLINKDMFQIGILSAIFDCENCLVEFPWYTDKEKPVWGYKCKISDLIIVN